MKTLKAEIPMFTVREIMELVKGKADINECKEILDEMKVWYFNNLHLITIGEDYAFKNELNNLYKYVNEIEKAAV